MIKKHLLALLLFSALLVSAATAMAAGPASIAVAAENSTPAAMISAVAARSPYFLFFDEKGDLVEAVANPHLQVPGGAGPQVVEFLAAKGIKTIIAGEFGAKMVGAMRTKGIASRIASGKVADAVRTDGGK
ncbi:MAG: hypothetical protein KKH22_11430 [Proteobacteria bacterium]|nr:hypothetical protein [Pseudomonadota bacterium]